MSRPPLRLLLFNLMTDETDPVLGFACDWIDHLAQRCEIVDVITMYRGAYQPPANVRVYSAGRELGLGKPVRLARFYRHLLRLLAARRYDACFAHMMPLFAGLAGPLLQARGIPTTLWYTHRQRSAQLRLGLLMSRRVVSADATSFPYATDKLRVIGHGIDTEFFAPQRATPIPGPSPIKREGGKFAPSGRLDGGEPLVLQVARLSPIKQQATAIRATAETGARLALIGGAPAGADPSYAEDLRALAASSGLGERCLFTGDQTREQVRDWYGRATVAVNLSPPGLFDKAALESMACGLPTIVANPAFAPLLGGHRDLLLTDGPADVGGLRRRLERLLALSPAERACIGRQLRRRVVEQHSLPGLTTRLVSVLRTGELPAPIP